MLLQRAPDPLSLDRRMHSNPVKVPCAAGERDAADANVTAKNRVEFSAEEGEPAGESGGDSFIDQLERDRHLFACENIADAKNLAHCRGVATLQRADYNAHSSCFRMKRGHSHPVSRTAWC